MPSAVQNGTNILLLVNTGTIPDPVYSVLASQRDLGIDEALETIDMSSKDAREQVLVGGRYSATIQLDAAWIPNDIAYGTLRDAARNATELLVRTQIAGTPDEEAPCLVTGVSRQAPDQGASLVSFSLAVTGPWVPAV